VKKKFYHIVTKSGGEFGKILFLDFLGKNMGNIVK